MGILFSILFLFSCRTQTRYIPDFSDYIDYSSKVVQYFGDTLTESNIMLYKYFNSENQLIEIVGHENRTKLKYDKQGKLTDKFHCRMYNCEIGWREKLFYDNYLSV